MVVSYADDFNVAAFSHDVSIIEARLNDALQEVSAWAARKQLKIAPSKSFVLLLTPDRHQSRYAPKVFYEGVQIPLNKTPKILGVHLDTHLTFGPHAVAVAAKASKSLRIVRATAGASWGHQKEVVLATARAFVAPLLNYAAPVWFPIASKSSIAKLQGVQNAALRVATGCHTASPIEHLHVESKSLPLADHLDMVSSQFLASA